MKLISIIKKLLPNKPLIKIVPITHIVTDSTLLDGHVALITGGTAGIGLSIAKSLIESGCKVIVASSTQVRLDDALSKLNSQQAKGLIMDLSKPNLFADSILEAEKLFGTIDLLVNSAGVHTENVDFFHMTPVEFDRVMNINLKGAYFITQAFASRIIEKGVSGKIVLLNSNRGDEPAFSPYGISKWGGKGMLYGLANELVRYGINVNAIAPGTTATGLVGYKDGDSIESQENKIGRIVMPDEIANVVKLLLSSAGNMITGEIIHISGGRGLFDIR